MKTHTYLIVSIFLWLGLQVPLLANHDFRIEKWDSLLQTNSAKNLLKVYPDLVFSVAERHYDYKMLDSLNSDWIRWAEKQYKPELVCRVLSMTLSHTPPNFVHSQLDAKINRLVGLLSKHIDHDSLQVWSFLGIARAAMQSSHYTKDHGELAEKYMLKALNFANEANMPEVQIRSQILLGELNLQLGNTIDAYNYLLASKRQIHALSEGAIKDELLYLLWDKLHDFFIKLKDWDEATAYKKKQIEYNNTFETVDSCEWAWLNYDLYRISQRSKRYIHLDADYLDLLHFADRHKLERLKKWSLAMYREYLINQSKFDQMQSLYEKSFPDELSEIKEHSPLLYCMIMGYLCVHKEKKDSALHHFNKAQRILEGGQEANFSATQYSVLGKIFERYNMPDSAHLMYVKSLQFANKADNIKLIQEALDKLIDITESQGMYADALRYSKRKMILKDSLFDGSGKAEVLRLSFTSEDDIAHIKAEKEYKAQKQKHRTQNWAIGAGLVLLSLILVVLSQMEVSEWVIEMLSFFVVLFIFEFVILYIDHELHYATNGAPLPMFLAKVALLSFLFPLHHLIEKSVLGYMKRQKRLKDPSQSLPRTIKRKTKGMLASLWPWLKSDKDQPS